MSNIERNKATVKRFIQAIGVADVDTIMDTYAEDGCVQTMGHTLISGVRQRDQIAEFSAGILGAFPEGLEFTILGMVAEGDKVAVEATSTGMHASGVPYEQAYHFLFEFRDGKLLKLKEYLDTELATDILCAGQRPQ
jgi:ketosteroid isomerase-like protein